MDLLEVTGTGVGSRVAPLLAQGANPNIRDPNPLHAGTTPLLNAARMCETNAVGTHLSHGADPNVADAGGWTPLMWAVATGDGNAPMGRSLHAVGADSARTCPSNGESTLQIARRFDHPQAAALLVRAGAQP